MWEHQKVFTLSHGVFTIEVWSSSRFIKSNHVLGILLQMWVLNFNKLHTGHAENPTTPQGTPSGAEGIASNASVKEDKNQRRRNRDKARRDSLTPEQREEMNARRRASRKNKTNEDRNASQRVARQNLTTKERLEMNARRRAASKNIPIEQRQEMNARRRARRQSIPPDERKALRAQRNADLAAKRKTPCAECIAMPCPDAYL
jgi:hypothetical protein